LSPRRYSRGPYAGAACSKCTNAKTKRSPLQTPDQPLSSSLDHRPSTTRRTAAHHHAARAFALATVVALAGCRNTVPAFGPTRAAAAANANDFFSAAAYRFTSVRRDRKYGAARSKLGRYALTPSKIFGDTAMWTAAGRSDRTLVLDAGYGGGHYSMGAASRAARALRQPGDAYHNISLTRLGNDQYRWNTEVDFAVGRMSADQLVGVLTSLLSGAEGRGGAELRADSRAVFPRASVAFGRLFTVDALTTARDAAGATLVDLSVSLHSDRLRRTYPAFANYVDKYVAPARYRVTLADRAGTRYFTTAAQKNRLTFRMRVKNGELVALDGAPRPMPDALVMRSEAYAKFGVFTVGASDIVSEFSFVRTPNERGWFLRFNREPDWHLPLAAGTLLKAPLRRPFAQGGATLRLSVRDAAGRPTVIARRTETAVQESAVLRFLGALGSSAINDFAGKSEEEENRFWVDGFTALRADAAAAAALLPSSE
jgi:hypothetical protein